MNFALALQTLAGHGVQFVVVGGAAVVAHGSSLMTEDLDVLYLVEPDNVRRLLAALEQLDARVYDDPRNLRFSFEHLNNTGHHLNDTKAGRIDVLGSLGVKGDILYQDVIGDAVELEAFGVTFHCISLEQLLAVKRELGRPRDLAAVAELEALKRLRESEGEG